MRFAVIALAAALAACATGGAEPDPDAAPSPFPVERGAAPPPPHDTSGPAAAAPPEGRAAGGLDFGQWRGADPAQYEPGFQARVRERLDGKTQAQARADLEANGFACEDGRALDCRIEIMERDCAIDWYVVLERARPEPVAGFDVMCLGAR